MGYGDNLETKKPSTNPGDIIWNILTLLILMSCIGMVGVFALIYINPYVPFNPFKPQPLPQVVIFPEIKISKNFCRVNPFFFRSASTGL